MQWLLGQDQLDDLGGQRINGVLLTAMFPSHVVALAGSLREDVTLREEKLLKSATTIHHPCNITIIIIIL